MQKLVPAYGIHFKPVVLYRDDIENIVAVVSELSERIELSTEAYTFQNVSEWADQKREVYNHLHITGFNPYISIKLDRDSIWLYIDEDNAVQRGALEKVKDILKKRRVPFLWLLNNWVPSLLTGSLIGPAYSAWMQGKLVRGILLTTAIIVCLLLTAKHFYLSTRSFSVIYPKYEVDIPGFWKRNSDKVMVGLICAVAGALLALAVKALIP